MPSCDLVITINNSQLLTATPRQNKDDANSYVYVYSRKYKNKQKCSRLIGRPNLEERDSSLFNSTEQQKVIRQNIRTNRQGPSLCDNYGGGMMSCMAIIIQQDAKDYSLFKSVNCSTCFGRYFTQSAGAHNTVSTVSGINQTFTAACRERGWINPTTLATGSR